MGIGLLHVKHPCQIVSIDHWTGAFLVLAAVYTEKKPTQAPALFKYIALIRDMS